MCPSGCVSEEPNVLWSPESVADETWAAPLLVFLQVLEDPSLGCLGKEVGACTETPREGPVGKSLS